MIYWGTPKKIKQEHNVVYHRGSLTQDSEYFNGAEENSDTIILSTYSTWSTRHGPNAQRRALVKSFKEKYNWSHQKARKFVSNTYTDGSIQEQLPMQLANCFERLVLDEGHEIRNMSPLVGSAVRWINAKYRDVITATPALSQLKEISGIIEFLQPRHLTDPEWLQFIGFEDADGDDALKRVLERFDPWTEPGTSGKGILKSSKQALDQ